MRQSNRGIKACIFFALNLVFSDFGWADSKQLLWGDTHLHTTFSSDAFVNNNLASTPNDAYRFAKGEPVLHPYNGVRVQLERPLDFLVVSDHAEFMGVMRNTYFHGADAADIGWIDRLKARVATFVLRDAIDDGQGRKLFLDVLPTPFDDPIDAAKVWEIDLSWVPEQPRVEADAWRQITEAADQHNQPGDFSAIIGWEYSSIPGGGNLHRVVMTDIDATAAQTFIPFGLDQSIYPEDLWTWLDKTRKNTGGDFIAIPHNSNISKGAMFSDRTLRGEPMTAALAEIRQYWEPIVEITQIKGDSETHSLFSPEDAFADFENYPFYIQRGSTTYQPRRGDFIRPALRRGLELGARLGSNPFQFGVIGSTDAHSALSSADEDNFLGKMATDSIPANKNRRLGDSAKSTFGWAMGASGRAAIWAEENSRAAILAAMRRREVYATTGPRIGVRVYAGWNVTSADLEDSGFPSNVLTRAVPMGGELPDNPGEEAPTLLIEATADPLSGHLDRIQVVKGWLDATGNSVEQVFNVAWAGNNRLLDDGSLTAIASTVDLRTGGIDNSPGAAHLSVAWTDPWFDPLESAFYYVRVLQIPTARHSLYDKIALGGEVETSRPDTLQERAYTSAIWYTAP